MKRSRVICFALSSLLILYALVLSFQDVEGGTPLFQDDGNRVQGGDFERGDAWTITDFSPESTTEYEFGYTGDAPQYGQDGCLRIRQGASFGQFLIWQRVTLIAGETYRATAAIRAVDYVAGPAGGGVWYQMYIDPTPVDETASDYNPGGIKLFNMDSWNAGFQQTFDGLWEDLNLGGGVPEAPYYTVPGTAGEEVIVTVGLKIGQNWPDYTGTSFELLIDEMGLFPVDDSVDVAEAIKSSLEHIEVDIHLNVMHTVGGVSAFDRSKFMNLHASQTEPEWEGPEQLEYILNELDVYLGRDVGSPILYLSQVPEDPARPGYPDLGFMQEHGEATRQQYDAKTSLHPFEAHSDLILSTHVHPFFPDGSRTGQGWAFADSAATAEFIAHFIRDYYGDSGGVHGEPRPQYYEIMNEPVYELVVNEQSAFTTADIFDYHNVVAERVRALNPDLKIGGFTAAYTNFETNDFQEWETHWKLFMDMTGDNMDFFSFHLYDFPFEGNQWLKTGSNVEAVFDMLEQYSMLKFGVVKPMYISEYGAFDGAFYDEPWSELRDWKCLKSYNAMLMNFMERPDNIIKTIPFIVVKGIWGAGDYAYPWTLMREENGEWVYTEMLKLYQLWAGVQGTRVDSYPSDPDIQVDAFADGAKVYVVLNNLNFEPAVLKLNLFGAADNPVQHVSVRHLHLVDNSVALDVIDHAEDIAEVQIDREATIILEYTFAGPVEIDQRSDEVKYYADDYLQPIVANQETIFHLDDVALGDHGEAVLRLGIGRAHGSSLRPTVAFNGTLVTVPDDFRGYDQRPRPQFFGVIEIPVPYELLQADNTVSVTFDDDGGHISSVTMQTFQFSQVMIRTPAN